MPTDYVGLTLSVVGIGALQMMLDRGKELDRFCLAEKCITLSVAALRVFIAFLLFGNWEKNIRLSIYRCC